MNADNVKPYGQLVHEAAKAGGVEKFCDAIEQNGYFKGASDKKDELIPYMIAMGIAAITEGAVIGYHFIKDKLKQRALKKANLEKESQLAKEQLNKILQDYEKEDNLNEKREIINTPTSEQDDIS